MRPLFLSLVFVISILSFTSCTKKSSNKDPQNQKITSDSKKQSEEKSDRKQNTLETEQASSEQKDVISNNGLGFYNISDANLPEKVKKASESVFHLKVLGDEATRFFNLETELEELKKLIANEKNADSMDKIVISKMIEFCQESENSKFKQNCPIVFSIHNSTGFTTNNGLTLWTNAHAIEPFLKLRAQDGKNSIEKQLETSMPIGVFIFNQKGELVINPYKEKIRPLNLPKPSIGSKNKHNFYAEDSDYISLSLPKKISEGLVVSLTTPNHDESVFLLGYAACTGCATDDFLTDDKEAFQDRSPAPNSDGKNLKITKGVVLDKKIIMPEIYQKDENQQPLWSHENILAYSADSNHGMSGGPVLNQSGEVVAIHRGGFFRNHSNLKMRVSNGFMLNNSGSNNEATDTN